LTSPGFLAKRLPMKQLTCLTIAACASLALSLTAFGGPEPLPSGKEMKEVAPAPPPECFDWSGFYIGAFGGYKHAAVKSDLDATGDWLLFPLDKVTIENHAADNNDLDADGAEVGGFLGFNFQRGCWVFGIEGDGGAVFLRDSFDSGTFPNPTVSDKSIQQAFRTNYLATVGGRLGYSIERWLPYVTAGVAFGNVNYESRLHNVSTSGAGFYRSADSEDDDNVGWFVGGGMQYALNTHWGIRMQYEFIDLGSVSYDAPGTVPFVDFSTHNRAELHEHNVSFALMYKF
jgi:outer membrane immunogenic protein